MRALITGIAGFAGSHLADFLIKQREVDVAGIARRNSDLRNIAVHVPTLRLYMGDVGDYAFLESAIREWRPELVFHLAAQAAPSLAWQKAEETLRVNVLGQYNLLRAISELVPEAAILVVGSGEEYGVTYASELPIREDNPLRPTNPYAVSKIAQDMLGYQFFLSHGLRVVRVRPFNHIGPRQGEDFVMASFASQIAAIETGARKPVLMVGNLDPRRDFCDVRDMVRGYWLALTQGLPGDVYNIGSGSSRSIAEMLKLLVQQSSAQIGYERDPSRFRPSDVPEVVCDSTRFRRQTGWQPEFTIERTLHDLLDYWRCQQRGTA